MQVPALLCPSTLGFSFPIWKMRPATPALPTSQPRGEGKIGKVQGFKGQGPTGESDRPFTAPALPRVTLVKAGRGRYSYQPDRTAVMIMHINGWHCH